jgi:type VI secretion system protein ImpM
VRESTGTLSSASNSPGIHGKLPSHGDFITRRLSQEFVEVWDDWLQRAVASSRTALGESWLDIYLTSPIWSFVLAPGICGSSGWAGILMPSVDRVGRYFPLTLAAPIPAELSPCDVLGGGDGWFERARVLALSSLEEGDFSLDAFDAAVAALGTPEQQLQTAGGFPVSVDVASGRGLYLSLPSLQGPGAALLGLADGAIAPRLGPYSIWWSEGSERIAASVLLVPGLPNSDAFTAFLDGRFGEEHWFGSASAPLSTGNIV